MADMSLMKRVSVSENALEELLILLQNLFAGLSEYMREKEAEAFKEAMHELALADPEKNPLKEKIYAIANSVWQSSAIPLEEKQKIIEQLSSFGEDHKIIPARAGLAELKEIFSKSGLSAEAKITIDKMIRSAEYSMDDPMFIKVDRSMYNAMKRIINEKGVNDILQGNFTAMPCASGDYMFIFNRSMKDTMSNIAIAAGRSLGVVERPSPEDVKAQAYAQAGNDIPAVLVFRDVPAETAERAVVESGHVGMVTFAKSKQDDGRYTLTCLAGNGEDERRECLTRAKNILAYSAYMTTGTAGVMGKAQARHTANEYEKIAKVLDSIADPEIQEEDAGYIFSIHTIEPNGKKLTLANDFIEFDRESFTCHYMGALGRTVTAAESPDTFLFSLESNIKSGSGQKVYISKSQMDKIEKRSEGVLAKLSALQADNSLDAMARLEEKVQELNEQKGAADSDLVRDGINNELNDVKIMFDVFEMYGCPPAAVTYEMVKDRMIADELNSHVFQFRVGYEAKKLGMEAEEVKDIIDTEKAMAAYSFRNNDHMCGSGLTVAGKPMTAFHANDLNGIEMFNPNGFISYETMEQAVTQGDIEAGRKSAEQVEKENRILDKYHAGHISEAKQILSQITVEMNEVHVDREIDTPSARRAKDDIDRCMENIKAQAGRKANRPVEVDIHTEPEKLSRDETGQRGVR